jgi:hypothetical protein
LTSVSGCQARHGGAGFAALGEVGGKSVAHRAETRVASPSDLKHAQ